MKHECPKCGVTKPLTTRFWRTKYRGGESIGFEKSGCRVCYNDYLAEFRWWKTRRLNFSSEAVVTGIATSPVMIRSISEARSR